MSDKKGYKMVTCHICGEVISKRKTYSIGNGKRACKTHKESQEHKAKLEAVESKKREETRKRVERDARFRDNLSITKPMCWVCGHKGIHAKDFLIQKVVDMEKYRIVHGSVPNIFDPEYMKRQRTTEHVIFAIKKSKIDENLIRRIIHRDCHQIVIIAGFVSICADCIHEHGIENPLNNTKDMDLKTMLLIGDAVRPVLKKEALKQLGRDN